MKKQTIRWVRKAEADLTGVRRLLQIKPPLRDLVCFHCQQAAEKYLKALLLEYNASIPRTHNLESLLILLFPHDPTLVALRRGLVSLSRYAADYRYPGESATTRQAQAALRWAERVRGELRQRLGIP